jgi:hypothetical protein
LFVLISTYHDIREVVVQQLGNEQGLLVKLVIDVHPTSIFVVRVSTLAKRLRAVRWSVRYRFEVRSDG